MRPKSWPTRLSYGRESISSEMNMCFLRSYLYTGNPEDYEKHSWVIEEKCVHPHLEIKKIQKPHPLYYQKTGKGYVNYGVFAKEHIETGAEIGEYVGELCLRNGDYSIQSIFASLSYSEYRWFIKANNLFLIIDGQSVANELAFINDYRGISLKPNVEMKAIIHQGLMYYGYVTLSDIHKGEEILVNYGDMFLNKG
ncbi:MAG: SET domain-containing protein-lysine N-methyltransferase [Chlamydiota bacterium]